MPHIHHFSLSLCFHLAIVSLSLSVCLYTCFVFPQALNFRRNTAAKNAVFNGGFSSIILAGRKNKKIKILQYSYWDFHLGFNLCSIYCVLLSACTLIYSSEAR